jgi:predicted transcriptional regulator
MSNDDIDNQVTAHLARLVEKDEAPETVGEIADQLAVSVSRVRPSIKRLVGYGEVREAGVAANGGKTWTLTSDKRGRRA